MSFESYCKTGIWGAKFLKCVFFQSPLRSLSLTTEAYKIDLFFCCIHLLLK